MSAYLCVVLFFTIKSDDRHFLERFNRCTSCRVLQPGLPHDGDDVPGRHVLPAGHTHRPGMEHVKRKETECVGTHACTFMYVRVYVATHTRPLIEYKS